MRITIEPTTDQSDRSTAATQHRVIVEHPHDDLSIWDMSDLIRDVLAGYGYHHNSIDDILERH